MNSYGIPLSRVCQLVSDGADEDGWCIATIIVGHLRSEIPPERATRLYIHWGNHSKIEKRKQQPAEVQLDQGRKHVTFRCLSTAKRRGLLESRGPTGGQREYRLTNKGRELLKGAPSCQP